MAVDGISTFGLHQKTLSDIKRIENDLANQQIQLSSGFTSQDFAGMAQDTEQYLSLETSIRRIDQYLSDNQLVDIRLNTTNTVLDQFVTTATALQNLIIQRRTGVTDTSAFAGQVRGLWQEMVGELNTAIEGRYLFGGTKIDAPPVESEIFPLLDEN